MVMFDYAVCNQALEAKAKEHRRKSDQAPKGNVLPTAEV
jgi:hypothetical protein